MPGREVEVAIVGGGAAGIAAARRLRAAGIDCLIVEARPRLGGRGWTIRDPAGQAIDLGCGWLHSADRNPWRALAQEQGLALDETPPPWTRPSLEIGFPRAEQEAFQAAIGALFQKLEDAAAWDHDVAGSTLLVPGDRWNGLFNATSTYISGVELDRFSVKDFDRYEDTGVNWRVVSGYGALIAGAAADCPVALGCAVTHIDHRGPRVRLETAAGTIEAGRVIVTVPSNVLGDEAIGFTPALPAKIEAARGVPLGHDDKLFLALAGADEFPPEVRLFGRTDRAGTGAYHFRPFGRPQIEGYFGGRLAQELEAGGPEAFLDFARAELVALLGSDFGRRISLIAVHPWGRDPFARGAYSTALPGAADSRAVLAAPVDDRLFFAGEACSAHDFSTAHGAWHTGVAAADAVIAARGSSAASSLSRSRPGRLPRAPQA